MTKVKHEIIGRNLAGENHEVVTITGGGGYRRKPCAGCPWKVENAGSFPPEAFLLSAHTAYDQGTHEFACHESAHVEDRDGDPRIDNVVLTCAGFLLNGGVHNLTTRVKASSGKWNPDLVSDGGHDLFVDYTTMAVANGVDPDDPIIAQCRRA